MDVNGNGYVKLEAAVELVPRPRTMLDLTYSTAAASFLRSSCVRTGVKRACDGEGENMCVVVE
ncbi:hypothetical protein HN873_036111, partial [Arachis hypogaea]